MPASTPPCRQEHDRNADRSARDGACIVTKNARATAASYSIELDEPHLNLARIPPPDALGDIEMTDDTKRSKEITLYVAFDSSDTPPLAGEY